ncbi:MAG: sensor histidine kinase [Chitinophagaceae bacterium]|nr:sensor histidine kinase [Chitinophagaceae bacterium]
MKYWLTIFFSFLLAFTQADTTKYVYSGTPLQIKEASQQWMVLDPFTSELIVYQGKGEIPVQLRQKSNIFESSFVLENKSGFDRSLVLQFPKSGYVHVVVNGQEKKSTGALLPLQQRDLPVHVMAVQLAIPKDSSLTIQVQFLPTYGMYVPAKFDVKVEDMVLFEKNDTSRLFWQGIFLGIFMVMALYNLFIYFGVRDISYLYFVLSIVGLGLYIAFYYGFGMEYLWPNAPRWDSFCYTIIVPFTNMSRLLFTRSYLNTPVLTPSINWLLKLLLLASGVLLVISFTGYALDIDILGQLVDFIGILGILVYILMLSAGLVAYYQDHYAPARYFILANILLVIGAILFILRELNFLPDTFITRYLVQIGFLVQVIVFALGLTQRYNLLKLEAAQQRIDSELEKKEMIEKQKELLQVQVDQQTKDLKAQNLQLEAFIQQLEESRSQLTELNQVKDKLFSIISHDLRNPLATMQSFLKLITERHDQLSETDKEKLIAEAQQSLDYLNQLLYNLLQWSKSQMQLLEFRPDYQSVLDALERNRRLLFLQAQMKQIQVQVSSTDALTVYADKDMLDFMLRNLLSNAIKFSNKQSQVNIRAWKEGDATMIAVQDEGIGMSEQIKEQLLHANITSSRRGTGKERGTGLGVLITKEFITRHGGEMHIKTAPGEGTVFTLVFPDASTD